MRALLLLEGSNDLVGHVHGAVNILDVVELLKTVDEALNLLGVGAGDSVGVVGTMVVSEPLTWTPCSSSALETAMTSLAVVRRSTPRRRPRSPRHRPRRSHHKLILVAGSTVGDHGLLLGVLVQDLLGDDNLALALKLEGDGAGGAQVATSVGEGGTDISGGTVAVVGQAVDVDGDTGGTVASYTMFS